MVFGSDPSVTMNIRISEAPVVGLDLVAAAIENRTVRTGSSNGQWEQVTFEYDVFPGEQSFDMIILTEGSKDAIGLMFVDDVSVSTIDPNASNADFNGDDRVDGDDFLIWQSSFRVDDGGDANRDGVTDGDDFLIWQTQFGTASGSGSSAVPEPSAIIMLVLSAWSACLLCVVAADEVSQDHLQDECAHGDCGFRVFLPWGPCCRAAFSPMATWRPRQLPNFPGFPDPLVRQPDVSRAVLHGQLQRRVLGPDRLIHSHPDLEG